MIIIDYQSCVGYIQFVFFDDIMGEIVMLGGVGFLMKVDDDVVWVNVVVFVGEFSFMVDCLDVNCDIVDEKVVFVEICELLIGKLIQMLIVEGRVVLVVELVSYVQQGCNVYV